MELAVGDGARGWGEGRYDVIVLTGSTPVLADSFMRQLQPGGRIFAVVGEPPVMKARLTQWASDEGYRADDLFETVIRPLRNAPEPARFSF